VSDLTLEAHETYYFKIQYDFTISNVKNSIISDPISLTINTSQLPPLTGFNFDSYLTNLTNLTANDAISLGYFNLLAQFSSDPQFNDLLYKNYAFVSDPNAVLTPGQLSYTLLDDNTLSYPDSKSINDYVSITNAAQGKLNVNYLGGWQLDNTIDEVISRSFRFSIRYCISDTTIITKTSSSVNITLNNRNNLSTQI
jgi:hypothetical protein